MRCKKHFTDQSSRVGVCASCLRERLFSVIAAQAQAEARAQAKARVQTLSLEDQRKSDTVPPPLPFPRSVSPYISRRKSDVWQNHYHHQHSLPDHRFYGTPQIGPTGVVVGDNSRKTRRNWFSLFGIIRSRRAHVDSDSDPRVSVSNYGESCDSKRSSSWFSVIFPVGRKKQSRLFSLDESSTTTTCRQRRDQLCDRGMSPARNSESCEEAEWRDENSVYSSERAGQPVTRAGGRTCQARNASGLAFCLSPLVRASPSRSWNQKGITPPDFGFPGEIRVTVKPHLSNAKSYCANRSRKLADIGRFNLNH